MPEVPTPNQATATFPPPGNQVSSVGPNAPGRTSFFHGPRQRFEHRWKPVNMVMTVKMADPINQKPRSLDLRQDFRVQLIPTNAPQQQAPLELARWEKFAVRLDQGWNGGVAQYRATFRQVYMQAC